MSVRFLSLLAVVGAFFLFLPQPALARDSVDELCHRHCAGEYDKLVTAKQKLSDLERRMKDHEKRGGELDTESRKLNGKIGEKRRACNKAQRELDEMRRENAAQRKRAWEAGDEDYTRGDRRREEVERRKSDGLRDCGREEAELQKERNALDRELDGHQSTGAYMEQKRKKLDKEVDEAQKDYDDCMKKCRKTPAIYEKIPDSVLGDLSTSEQRRKWKEEARQKEEKEAAAKAKCAPCEKARTNVARAEDRTKELNKKSDALEAEERRLKGDRKALEDLEKLNRLRREKGRTSAAQARKEQGALDERRREIDERLKKIGKEQDALEDDDDAARRDLKRAREEQKKCNDKCTSGDKKSFLQGVLPGLSIGIGMGGGGRHHRREPRHHYEGGELR